MKALWNSLCKILNKEPNTKELDKVGSTPLEYYLWIYLYLGANNEGAGKVTCTPHEWDSATGLGPEAMFFESGSTEFEIWAVSTHLYNFLKGLMN